MENKSAKIDIYNDPRDKNGKPENRTDIICSHFLDAVEKRWIEERGGMNIFFVFDAGSMITPPLGGTILVCHLGCEINAQLVLRGDHPGRLWVDNTGAELACWGSYSDYYEMWLDEGLLGWNWH